MSRFIKLVSFVLAIVAMVATIMFAPEFAGIAMAGTIVATTFNIGDKVKTAKGMMGHVEGSKVRKGVLHRVFVRRNDGGASWYTPRNLSKVASNGKRAMGRVIVDACVNMGRQGCLGFTKRANPRVARNVGRLSDWTPPPVSPETPNWTPPIPHDDPNGSYKVTWLPKVGDVREYLFSIASIRLDNGYKRYYAGRRAQGATYDDAARNVASEFFGSIISSGASAGHVGNLAIVVSRFHSDVHLSVGYNDDNPGDDRVTSIPLDGEARGYVYANTITTELNFDDLNL